MLFSRFPAGLVLALEKEKYAHGVVCLKLGSSGNVSFASLYPAS